MARKKHNTNTLPLYILLVVLFVVYITMQSIVFISYLAGIAIFLLIIGIIILEVTNSTKGGMIKRDIIELVLMVALVLIAWVVIKYALGTNYPIDVVPSCSMLPTFHRGDIILIRGLNSPTTINAPIVNVSASSYNAMLSNIGNEFLSCVAYTQNGSSATISQEYHTGDTIGLYKYSPYGGSIVSNSSQSGNLVRFICGTTPVKTSTGQIEYAATKAIIIGNTVITGDQNNTPIVYSTVPSDLFYKEGDSFIVHRVYAIINASGKYYTLTKGDNNPGLDMQYGNYPANLSQVQGKVILDIPYLGYLKLVLSDQLGQPAGCNTTMIN
jgi:signal peptidase I